MVLLDSIRNGIPEFCTSFNESDHRRNGQISNRWFFAEAVWRILEEHIQQCFEVDIDQLFEVLLCLCFITRHAKHDISNVRDAGVKRSLTPVQNHVYSTSFHNVSRIELTLGIEFFAKEMHDSIRFPNSAIISVHLQRGAAMARVDSEEFIRSGFAVSIHDFDFVLQFQVLDHSNASVRVGRGWQYVELHFVYAGCVESR
mmetsp:Transcript_12655/g.26601  ORF Transcript_12655/g.26601 Transcript_12655/m.26601 type:complete len:200 (-) Transcript_12655:106-705(-)